MQIDCETHDLAVIEAARLQRRVVELESAVLAAKTLLHPTTDETEPVWQLLDQAYHQHKPNAKI